MSNDDNPYTAPKGDCRKLFDGPPMARPFEAVTAVQDTYGILMCISFVIAGWFYFAGCTEIARVFCIAGSTILVCTPIVACRMTFRRDIWP